MSKRAVLVGFVSAFLLLLTLWAPFLSSVAASPSVIVVPNPSFRIRDAINAGFCNVMSLCWACLESLGSRNLEIPGMIVGRTARAPSIEKEE